MRRVRSSFRQKKCVLLQKTSPLFAALPARIASFHASKCCWIGVSDSQCSWSPHASSTWFVTSMDWRTTADVFMHAKSVGMCATNGVCTMWVLILLRFACMQSDTLARRFFRQLPSLCKHEKQNFAAVVCTTRRLLHRVFFYKVREIRRRRQCKQRNKSFQPAAYERESEGAERLKNIK